LNNNEEVAATVGAFFRELLHVGIYKRNQGRITRQITFAALVVAVAIGLWRLGGVLERYDPWIAAAPARVVCFTKTGSVEADGRLRWTGNDGTASATIHKGENLVDVANVVNAAKEKTGVAADTSEDKTGVRLILTSVKVEAEGKVELEAPPDAFRIEGVNAQGVAHGRNPLNFGLRFLIPGLLLAATAWGTYRLVNVPAFADFLIAVEAEMNKVSWPTRTELSRSSLVVLVLIFALAILLYAFDVSWQTIFRRILNIY
jgi:preprotein translocase SecE subunit